MVIDMDNATSKVPIDGERLTPEKEDKFLVESVCEARIFFFLIIHTMRKEYNTKGFECGLG